MRALRDYFRSGLPVASGRKYISNYWKHGLSEDQHKAAKREDEDAFAAI